MGTVGSKASASASSSSSSSSSSSGARRVRSKAHRVLHSSCLGTTSRSHDSDNDDQVCDHQNKENGSTNNLSGSGIESNQSKIECYRKVKVGRSGEIPCISSNANTSASTNGSSSAPASSITQNLSSRFLSRFSFIPGNMSFRLSRANSLGSSRSYPVSSTSLGLMNNEEDAHLPRGSPNVVVVDTDQNQQGTPTLCCQDTSSSLHLNTQPGFSENLGDDRTTSFTEDNAMNTSSSGSIVGADLNLCSPRNHSEMDSAGIRLSDRHAVAREPIERNVRFSRTLSVGRLRDRVLRRSSLSDISFCPVQQVGEDRDTNSGSGMRAWGDQNRTLASESTSAVSPNASGYSSSNLSSSLFSIQDYEVETSRAREARYRDLLEHRSNFLERRRRIRSQVRALQRLGSRFENLSRHERSCIMSGQHRTGRCTCRSTNRDEHLNDDTSARASISRIVMLAEALFEQSVVLSSRPSVSSIGSVPAPNEVVESLPVKLYTKLHKHQSEEVAQCYICLVEYEEGDRMRILPCQHDFHKTCVDKWLKEIHRVCPLCRGDICRSNSLPAEN
ncbi:suppressor protein SRP40 isoform X2 [Cannabis sativa]|uniref:suppressor protein SRP40 isoform X2 n=1 Tax=Cannabis sativa TaxID=3483 RepID=UPI0011DF7C81|nr:suppressor protein SRP40 isoform X2 [Cannabis sativa]